MKCYVVSNNKERCLKHPILGMFSPSRSRVICINPSTAASRLFSENTYAKAFSTYQEAEDYAFKTSEDRGDAAAERCDRYQALIFEVTLKATADYDSFEVITEKTCFGHGGGDTAIDHMDFVHPNRLKTRYPHCFQPITDDQGRTIMIHSDRHNEIEQPTTHSYRKIPTHVIEHINYIEDGNGQRFSIAHEPNNCLVL